MHGARKKRLGEKKKKKRQLWISDDFVLERPCFSLIEQARQLICIMGFLSGYWKWQHPYSAWFMKSILVYLTFTLYKTAPLPEESLINSWGPWVWNLTVPCWVLPVHHHQGVVSASKRTASQCDSSQNLQHSLTIISQLEAFWFLPLCMQISPESKERYIYALGAFSVMRFSIFGKRNISRWTNMALKTSSSSQVFQMAAERPWIKCMNKEAHLLW